MGYLGGVLVVVGCGLVTGRLWHDLSTGWRLALAIGAAGLLLLGGALVPVPQGGAGGRLRSVLWLGSSAATAGFLGLLGAESLHWSGEAVAALVGLGTAACSAVLWRFHRYPLQQVAVVAPLLVGTAAAAALLPDVDAMPTLSGLACWSVAAAWLARSWGGLVPGREVGMVLGSVGTVGGSLLLLDEGWGVVLALASLAGLVVLAVRARTLPLLGVASVGALLVLPPSMGRHFPGTLAPALVLLVVGAGLVVAAVLTTRRPPRSATSRDDLWVQGDARVARWLAGGTLVTTAAVVLAAGAR